MDGTIQSKTIRYEWSVGGLSMRVLSSSSLRHLCALCVSAVNKVVSHHRGTENLKATQRRTLILSFVLLSVAFFRVSAQETPADNWAQFRGNQRLTGVSEAKVPADLKLLWTVEAGDSIESSAAIVGGTVFVGSQKGELLSI